jgi:hypothetical protein
MLTPGRRQLRRCEAGWEGSPRRIPRAGKLSPDGCRLMRDHLRRAIEGVENSYARDGRQSELTITHAPHP